MPKKSIPKTNKITSTHRKAPPPQTQTGDDYNSEQPLKQTYGETDKAFLERQRNREQAQTQNANKPTKDGLVQRGKNYANDKIDKAKEYGTQKGKEALGKGADYAKGKGREFLDKNPKAAATINKAQEAKQNFEDRMNMFRDSAELSARKPPIKQMPGEKDWDFRRRQQKEESEAPENPQRMSLSQAAKQHGKDAAKKQLKKGTDFAKRKGQDFLAKNPRTAATLKEAKEKADAIKKRSEEIQKKVAERAKKVTDKIKALKELKKRLGIKKMAEDKIKEIALQIAKAVARFAIQVAVSVASAIIAALSEVIVIILIIVVIVAVIIYTCESTVGETFCSEVAGWL